MISQGSRKDRKPIKVASRRRGILNTFTLLVVRWRIASRHTRTAFLSLLISVGLVACSCSEQDEAALELGCADRANFSICGDSAGDTGEICISGACVARTACDPAGCDASGPNFPVPDTAVTACFGPSPDGFGGEIPCSDNAGEDDCADTEHCGQDAQYGWDVDHLASDRFQVTDGVLVEDQMTGLIWQRCAGGQAGENCAGEGTLLNWYDANDYCENLEWSGQTNWTLPSSHQLHSIADFSVTGPTMDTFTFPNAPSNYPEDYDSWWIDCIWSSSMYTGASDVAWAMMSNNGDILEGSGIEYHSHDLAAEGWDGCTVRCVQKSNTVQWERFIYHGGDEPVVIDVESERFWQGCSAGQTTSACTEDASLMNWADALSYCEGLSWGHFDDWRLPNIKELRTIVDERSEYPAIDSTMFPNTPHWLLDTSNINMGQYWSSTARDYNSFALYVGFNAGSSHFYIQSEGRHARCVRGP